MSALRGVFILLVEDNLDVRGLTAFLLEGLGARVLVAVNGADAFAKLLGNEPDLVLCDLMMPVMDGIEFAQRVRRTPERAHVRLVALTSRRYDETYMKASAAGFEAYLEKPISPEKLQAVAARFLSGPGATPPNPD
jgi:CheY-like chemotaxis protein